jgi:hypothetical protein
MMVVNHNIVNLGRSNGNLYLYKFYVYTSIIKEYERVPCILAAKFLWTIFVVCY